MWYNNAYLNEYLILINVTIMPKINCGKKRNNKSKELID